MTNPLASQQPAPIPDDLREMYYNVSHARPGYSPLTWNDEVKPLIERIARLEAALAALRDFMWAKGYADQTAVMRQADAALGTPTTKEFMQKVCSDAYEGTPGKGEK
jgi:hypothetical protein